MSHVGIRGRAFQVGSMAVNTQGSENREAGEKSEGKRQKEMK